MGSQNRAGPRRTSRIDRFILTSPIDPRERAAFSFRKVVPVMIALLY